MKFKKLIIILISSIFTTYNNIQTIDCKCFPVLGVSPNILVECGKDKIISIHTIDDQLFRFESEFDNGKNFFYPRPYGNKLYDQSINGGPLIKFDMEISTMDPVPLKGGAIHFNGVFFLDGKKSLKPVELLITDIETGEIIYNEMVKVKYLNKSNYLVNIPEGCGSDISIINPENNKIIYKTNYNQSCIIDDKN